MGFNYFTLSSEQLAKRKVVWDGLTGKKPFGRLAAYYMQHPDSEEVGHDIPPADEIPLTGPAGKMPEWDKAIKEQVRNLSIKALSQYQDDTFPALVIPVSYGQSQALAEPFGCRLIPQETEKDLFMPVPWIESAPDVDRIKVAPIENGLYWNAIEFTKYALEVTDGQLSIRNPVMTGPIDTANYILGTMGLMEWIYEEPEALHKLLRMITEMLIDTIKKLQKSANYKLCPDTGKCVDMGFSLCSEIRHLISADVYKEFEAPYLRQIGKACGQYMFHSCGTWERMLETDLEDPNLMMANFQSKEMDLEQVYKITRGRLSISVKASADLHERYLWPDESSFFRYLLTVFPEPVPLEVHVVDAKSFVAVQSELNGGSFGMSRY